MSARTMRRAVAAVATIPPDPLEKVSVDRCQLVLLILAHYANEYDVADPTLAELGDVLGMPRRCVQRAVRHLTTTGLIEVARPGGGRGVPAAYRVVAGRRAA